MLSLVKIGPEKKSSGKDLLNVANVFSLSYEIRLVLGKKHVSSGGRHVWRPPLNHVAAAI